MTRRLAALLLVLAGLLLPPAARAQDLSASLGKLAANSFEQSVAAIAELAASGHPRALELVQAIADGRLLVDPASRATVVRDAAGALSDAATGEALAAAPPRARPVRLNNMVRGALQAALGALTLMSPDPAKRRDAAAAVFKSRDAEALPLLEAALARETDPGIRALLAQARAAIVFGRADAPEAERLAAAELVAARGDQEAISLLRSLPADAAPALHEAAAEAVRDIERSLAVWRAVQDLWYGLSLGSVLLLAAIGLAITFGVMGVINMAHGEMVMIGAYTTFIVQEWIRQNSPGLFDWSLAIALPLAFLVSGAVGVAIERGIIRFLYGRPLETLLATWGLSLVLQQAVRSIFGPTNREVGNPSWMSGSFEVGQLSITYGRFWIIVFSFTVFVALLLVLRYTHFGLQMRAVTQNRPMADVMGIRTRRVDALTFGLGSGVAGIAGVALSQIDNVSPNLGQGYIIDSFMVVVFGGVGNLWGTLLGALTLGVANKLLEPYAGAVLGKILLLVFIILFIQRRPMGLFALKGRAVET